jgi:type II secretory pathway component PulK
MALQHRTRRRAIARRDGRRRGVALVAVLLLVAGLIAIATAVVTLSASQRRAAQRAYEADARREALDGAIRVALAEISFGKAQGPFWHPRQPRTISVGGKRVEVTLERESGRIDLNTADEKYLVAALVVSGMAESEARTGAARIRDWIDADDKPGPQGAEREEYRQAGVSYEPRNAPMESVEEVRQVMGLRGLSDASLDAFTVYSQQIEPAASEAPQGVRDALEWLADAAGEGGANVLPAETLPDSTQPVSYAGSVVRLPACIENESDAPCRTAVVRVTGSSRQPFQVLSWR